jgi:hypothetical protein
MSSTYTTRLALEKQGDGENPNSWGTILNQNVIDLLDTAIAGYQIVSVSSVGVSLTTNNGTADTSRTFGMRFEGLLTANVTVTIPQKEKIYTVFNGTTGSFAITMKTAGGTAITVPSSGNGTVLACDSININKCNSIDANVSITSLTATSVTASVGIFNVVSISDGTINGVDIGLVSAGPAKFTTVSATDIFDGIGNVRTVPINTQVSSYTLVSSDAGKFIAITTGGVTVPQNVFTAGQLITVYNNSGTSQTLTQGTSVTMFFAGTSVTGNRTITQRGLGNFLCVGSNIFLLSGAGVE